MATLTIALQRDPLPSFAHKGAAHRDSEDSRLSVKQKLDSEMVEFLPETQKVIEALEDFINIRHQDSGLDITAQHFTVVLKQNQEIFQSMPVNEKAQSLFALYKQQVFDKFKENPVVQETATILSRQFSISTFDALSSLEKIVDTQMTQLHRGFPEFSISKALGVSVTEVVLSGDSSCFKMITPALKVSKSHFFN